MPLIVVAQIRHMNCTQTLGGERLPGSPVGLGVVRRPIRCSNGGPGYIGDGNLQQGGIEFACATQLAGEV